MDTVSITAIIISIISLVIVVSFVARKKEHEREVKNSTQDAALKVDFFEDKIREAHEKLANTISYQFSDVINRLDILSSDLGVEGLRSTEGKYASMPLDELVHFAKPYVVEKQMASAELLRDKFGLGYLKAAKLLELLEEEGVIDENNGTGTRDVLLTVGDLADEEKETLETLKTVNLDDLYEDAKEVVITAQKASASLLQRRLKVGYARAAMLLDQLEESGVIGHGEGAKPRDVFINPDGTISQETENT